MASNDGLLSINYGLLWGIVACYFGLLGVPGGGFSTAGLQGSVGCSSSRSSTGFSMGPCYGHDMLDSRWGLFNGSLFVYGIYLESQ